MLNHHHKSQYYLSRLHNVGTIYLNQFNIQYSCPLNLLNCHSTIRLIERKEKLINLKLISRVHLAERYNRANTKSWKPVFAAHNNSSDVTRD